MSDFNDVRDSLRSDQASEGVPFWIPVAAIVAVGILGGLVMAAFNQPKSSIPKELAIFAEVTPPTGPRPPIEAFDDPKKALDDYDAEWRKEIEKASGDKKIFDRATVINQYAVTMNKARECQLMKGFDQMRAIAKNYERKNKPIMEAWRGGIKRNGIMAKIQSGEKMSDAEIMRAGLTGELRQAGTNHAMESMAMMGMMGGASWGNATPQACAKLRGEMQMGELNLPSPPRR